MITCPRCERRHAPNPEELYAWRGVCLICVLQQPPIVLIELFFGSTVAERMEQDAIEAEVAALRKEILG